MTSPPRSASRLTSAGTNSGDFSRHDWTLLLVTSLIWGSSFLWISFSLDAFHPGFIALLRMALGAAVLGISPAARKPIPRSSWGPLFVVALGGNAVPSLLFPFAQQRVESSVAGMMNSTSPVMVLIIAIAMTRTLPARKQVVGLGIGLLGAFMLALPNLTGADAQPMGVFLVTLAVLGYATSNNFIPPLQQAFGGITVVFWGLVISTVTLLPYGMWGLLQSDAYTGAIPASDIVGPLIALTILGIFGTGIARTMFANLVGSVGATRSSMIGYLVPIAAIVLGILVRNESVGLLEIAGTIVVLIGARIISRGKPVVPAAMPEVSETP